MAHPPARATPGEASAADRDVGRTRLLRRRPIASVNLPAARRFAVTAVVSAVLCWATYATFVLTETGQWVENLALHGAELRGATGRIESLGQLSTISLVSFGVAIVAVFGVAFLRRRVALGVLAAGIMVVSTLLAELLQVILPRPELVSGPAWILRNSFPGGHAAIAAAIGVGALLVVPDRLRSLALLIGAAFAAVIGQATQITAATSRV